jgi:hypothetical protein
MRLQKDSMTGIVEAIAHSPSMAAVANPQYDE